MPHSASVAVYFVASPLQYLAAKRIAAQFEPGARQVLIWYKPGVGPIVDPADWDASSYLPWPRFEPLPGRFGSHRRLRANIRLVADLVGTCDRLILHSAVYDTEAINYFLHALPAASHAREMHARILPDGLISIRRYPLNFGKRLAQHVRRLRRLFAPELDYQCFSGDRIGSDAPFCDRIYVLPGLPNEYPPEKVCVLPPLVTPRQSATGQQTGIRRALVVGQPLVETGLLSAGDLAPVTEEIRAWLAQQGITEIYYKAHPKDLNSELRHADYRMLESTAPLESHMADTAYDAVVGVRSSALLFARQIYPKEVRVCAFGWERVHFKSAAEADGMKQAFLMSGVELL